MESIIIGEFQMTGANKINVDLVIKKWNHLWWISEWRNEEDHKWRIVKYIRKDSPLTEIKLTMSSEQAKELIDKLGLVEEWCGVFRSGYSWRKQSDVDALEEWRSEKYKKKAN